MTFFQNWVLIDKLKTRDKRKEDVNGIIYRLLVTQMLEGFPPIINFITSLYTDSWSRIYCRKALSRLAGTWLSNTLKECIWDSLPTANWRQTDQRKRSRKRWLNCQHTWSCFLIPTVTLMPDVLSLQDIACFDTPFCEIVCTLWMKNIL